MTPTQIRAAREKLGLTQEQMATMLGFAGVQGRQEISQLEVGARAIADARRRLVVAYLSGYRPPDWPG